MERVLEKEMMVRAEEREHMGRTIMELKEQLQHTEVNFVREKDRFEYWGADLEKQNILLKTDNKRMVEILEDNDRLSSELNSLRSLLMESSYEIDRSKEELIRISYERDNLAVKFEKAMAESEKVFRINRGVEEEAARQMRGHFGARPFYR